MMKVIDISREMDGSAVLYVYADTKSEVPANVSTIPTIVGLPKDVTKIASNSTFKTASFDIGTVQTDGTVVWI